MNNSKTRVLALFGLIATIGISNAMAQSRIPFTIPFGFTVGAKSFVAGDYQVAEVVPDVILVQSRDGHAAMITLCHTGESGKTDGPTLVFHKYGSRYFLSEVRLSKRGSALPMSAGEKELIAGRIAPQVLAVGPSVR